MMDLVDLFSADLMALEVEVASQKELFQFVSKELIRQDYVFDNYVSGIIKREEEFPTGLMTKYLPIGLPHSDVQDVKRPFIYFCRLKKGIKFHQMGDNQPMMVRDVFFLGIKEPKKQVVLLATMMTLFADQFFVDKLVQSRTRAAIMSTIKEFQLLV